MTSVRHDLDPETSSQQFSPFPEGVLEVSLWASLLVNLTASF